MTDTLRERVSHLFRTMYATEADRRIAADAAIALCMEEAAKVAVGPVYRTNPKTGEPSLHGTDAGNWSVPQPLSGFTCSDYGKGRYDAATAIRALGKP